MVLFVLRVIILFVEFITSILKAVLDRVYRSLFPPKLTMRLWGVGVASRLVIGSILVQGLQPFTLRSLVNLISNVSLLIN